MSGARDFGVPAEYPGYVRQCQNVVGSVRHCEMYGSCYITPQARSALKLSPFPPLPTTSVASRRPPMRSSQLLIAGLAITAVVVGVPNRRLEAQSAGTVEVGGFGQFTRTDAAWHVKNGGGAGGRLGVFLTSHLELEAAASFSSFTNEPPRASGSSSAQTFNGQFTFNIPFGAGGRTHDLLFEAGAGVERFADHNDFSVPLGGGLRIALTDAIALRFDGIVE